MREIVERRFAPSERSPKCWRPALKNSWWSELRLQTYYPQRSASRYLLQNELPRRGALTRVLLWCRQRNAIAHPARRDLMTNTLPVGLRLLNHRTVDKNCRALPMIQPGTVERRWGSGVKIPHPFG